MGETSLGALRPNQRLDRFCAKKHDRRTESKANLSMFPSAAAAPLAA